MQPLIIKDNYEKIFTYIGFIDFKGFARGDACSNAKRIFKQPLPKEHLPTDEHRSFE